MFSWSIPLNLLLAGKKKNRMWEILNKRGNKFGSIYEHKVGHWCPRCHGWVKNVSSCLIFNQKKYWSRIRTVLSQNYASSSLDVLEAWSYPGSCKTSLILSPTCLVKQCLVAFTIRVRQTTHTVGLILFSTEKKDVILSHIWEKIKILQILIDRCKMVYLLQAISLKIISCTHFS